PPTAYSATPLPVVSTIAPPVVVQETDTPAQAVSPVDMSPTAVNRVVCPWSSRTALGTTTSLAREPPVRSVIATGFSQANRAAPAASTIAPIATRSLS